MPAWRRRESVSASLTRWRANGGVFNLPIIRRHIGLGTASTTKAISLPLFVQVGLPRLRAKASQADLRADQPVGTRDHVISDDEMVGTFTIK
jgi:hypothetical protein